MTVTLLFFSTSRTAAGCGSAKIDLPEGASAADGLDEAIRRFPQLRALRPALLLAKNREWCSPEATLAEGDELAIMPPVSGG
jgi:molybdopterin synthase catalytic subunit